MAPPSLTPERRSVAAALLFLGSAALAGVQLTETGVRYAAPGMVSGVFALLLTFILLTRGAWARAPGAPGWVAVAYGTAANAQVLGMLLPPPGIVQWVVVLVLAFTAWGALATGTRTRLAASLGSLALLLALVKFSVIPVLWGHIGPAPGEGFGLGSAMESVRRVFADYQPTRPAGEALGVVALAFWALGTRLLWEPEGSPDAPPNP